MAYVICGVRRSGSQPGVILLPPPRGGHRVKSGDICGHHSQGMLLASSGQGRDAAPHPIVPGMPPTPTPCNRE